MCEEDLFSNVRRCLHLSFVWFKNKNANRKFSLLNLVVYFTFYLTFNKFISCHIQWMLFHGYSTSLQIIGIGWLMSLKWIFTIEIHLKALDSSQNIANTRTKKIILKKIIYIFGNINAEQLIGLNSNWHCLHIHHWFPSIHSINQILFMQQNLLLFSTNVQFLDRFGVSFVLTISTSLESFWKRDERWVSMRVCHWRQMMCGSECFYLAVLTFDVYWQKSTESNPRTIINIYWHFVKCHLWIEFFFFVHSFMCKH